MTHLGSSYTEKITALTIIKCTEQMLECQSEFYATIPDEYQLAHLPGTVVSEPNYYWPIVKL